MTTPALVPVQGFWDASHPVGTGRCSEGPGPSPGGSLVPRIRGQHSGLGTPPVAGDTAGALQPRLGDAEIAAPPASVNYLASMFINQQFLCKQTHPELCFPSPWQQHRAEPGSGCAPGSHLGTAPPATFCLLPFPPTRSLQGPGPSQHWILSLPTPESQSSLLGDH